MREARAAPSPNQPPPAAPPGPAGRKIVGIQFARGAAALLVALYHFDSTFAQTGRPGVWPQAGLFGFGHAGVEFFFVLSGFIIFHVHGGELGRPAALRRYAWRRLTRIYPVYWAVLAVYIVKAAVTGTLDPGHVARSALLLPQHGYPLVTQAWTLTHELLFYLLFAVAIASRRLGIVVFAAWAGLIVWTAATGTATPSEGGVFFGSYYNAMFFLGMAVAWGTGRWRVPWPAAVTVLGIVGFLATGAAEVAGMVPRGPTTISLYGITSAIALVGLVGVLPRPGPGVTAAATLSGDASYPLYLVHSAVAAALIPLMHRLAMPGWLALPLLVVAAVAAALAINHLIERPALRRLQAMVR